MRLYFPSEKVDMKRKEKRGIQPDLSPEELQKQKEERRAYRRRFLETLWSTIKGLVNVAAVAVLIAVLLLPVLQIYGNSMNPTLEEGNYVLSIKTNDLNTGDVIAFYYNNKILVKRVIANAGDWVDIDEDGTVYVNNVKIDEPYVDEPAIGECDIELPYQVPESRIFVMGDHRSVSIDSRSRSIGCVAEEQIVGKIIFRIWPLPTMGIVR